MCGLSPIEPNSSTVIESESLSMWLGIGAVMCVDQKAVADMHKALISTKLHDFEQWAIISRQWTNGQKAAPFDGK